MFEVACDMINPEDPSVRDAEELHNVEVRRMHGTAIANPDGDVKVVGQPNDLVAFFHKLGYNQITFDFQMMTGEAW